MPRARNSRLSRNSGPPPTQELNGLSLGDEEGVLFNMHADLARRYRRSSATVERIWRSMDKRKRMAFMKRGSQGGVLLKDRSDESLGNANLVMPEWNLREITEPGSDCFLDLLRYRATTSLLHQYYDPSNGGAGDRQFIMEKMRTDDLRHPQKFNKGEFTMFLGNTMHGETYSSMGVEADEVIQEAIDAGVCVPRGVGELIALRQSSLISVLTALMEEIIDVDEESRIPKTNKKPDRPGARVSETGNIEALSKLEIHAPPTKLALPDLTAVASEQKDSLAMHLDLLATEPLALAYDVSNWFSSQPELIPDEKGRQLPHHTDKYMSRAFLDAIHAAIQAIAIWDYLGRLLELLDGLQSDKLYRALVLQEISNVCQLEYCRVQSLLKRHVQIATGWKWFKRISNSYDKEGRPRVTMRGDPESLTRSNPQLHYLLRLCQSQTTSAQAVEWLKKLGNLYAAHPLEREKLKAAEHDTICDLATIVGFIQDTGPIISMPSFSRKNGQAFVARWQQVGLEVDQLRTEIDLTDLVAPIEHLVDPGASEVAWKALDEFIAEKTGTKLGYLYEDLVEECLLSLQAQYEQAKDQARDKDQPVPVFDTPEPPAWKDRIEQRKQKEKTRPLTTSAYQATPGDQSTAEDLATAPSTLKVRAPTADVFAALFPGPGARTPITWEAFLAAMTNVGFAVMPKYGSVYTFFPPESMPMKKPLTLHRPHGSQIEGYKLLSVARRLKKLYGWNEQTFEVA